MVYEAANTGLTIADVNDVLNRMATDNLAKQLSSSWSWGGGTNANGDQIFLQFAAQGQSFFEASGDSGAYSSRNPISEPSDDPYLTVVGGTTLTTSGPGGSWVSETVWSPVSRPGGRQQRRGQHPFHDSEWQQGISMTANLGSTNMRNIPDVALTADNILVVYNNGSLGDFGGTSCAAPLWAAFTALVNQRGAAHGQGTVGFINPAVYAIGKGTNYASDFHDITTGNNTNRNSPPVPCRCRLRPLHRVGHAERTNMINALGRPAVADHADPTSDRIQPASSMATPLSASQLNATASVPGTFAYNPASGAVLNAGSNVLSVVFTPNDTFDYNSVTDSVSLTVSQAPLSVMANNATRSMARATRPSPPATAALSMETGLAC